MRDVIVQKFLFLCFIIALISFPLMPEFASVALTSFFSLMGMVKPFIIVENNTIRNPRLSK